MPSAHPSQMSPARRYHWIARLLCALFAILGALPFSVALALRTQTARTWAAREISTLLDQQLGLHAAFGVHIRPWPLTLVANNLRVESSTAEEPFLLVDRVSIRPKLFSLIQGRVDAGDIEINRPRVRVEIRDGKLANLNLRTPQSSPSETETPTPLSSISVDDGSVLLMLDGVAVQGSGIDVDVSAEADRAFEISLHAGSFRINRNRPILAVDADRHAPAAALDEDVICKANGRIRVSKDNLLVRRLQLRGLADLSPDPATGARCDLAIDEQRRTEIEARNLRISFHDAGVGSINGHAKLRAPLPLVNRFAATLPLQGWIGLEADGVWTRGDRLPQVRGNIDGAGIAFGRYRLASDLSMPIRIERDTVFAPLTQVGFADGRVEVRDLEVHPLDKGVPLKAGRVAVSSLQFTGLMRDLGVSSHAHVKMLVREAGFSSIAGTIDPLRIDSELIARAHDFDVLDGAFDDPRSRRMIGVRNAVVRAHFAVTPRAVEFQAAHVEFGKSHLSVFTALGFHNEFHLQVAKGSVVELEDVSPLADIPWSGKATIGTEITGTFDDPGITADVSINRFEFAGFSFGDVQSAKARFKPLILDLADVRGRKNASTFMLPSMQLNFNGPAPIRMIAELESPSLDLRDFFAILRFEKDPRFLDIAGAAQIKARLQYDLGGVLDRCGDGWLGVAGQAHVHRLELFGERFDEGEIDFEYRADDRKAQEQGVAVDARSVVLRKGTGSIIASGSVRDGGIVRAHAIASDIPLSSVQTLGSLAPMLDATVSATVEVGGTIDKLEADIDTRMSPLRFGSSVLPASRFAVHLQPIERLTPTIGMTRCGHAISPPFDLGEFAKDLPQGIFHLNGQLFGGQLQLQDLRITRQSRKLIAGQIVASHLDLSSLSPIRSRGEDKPHGFLSGVLNLGHFELDSPERADVKLEISQLEVGSSQGRVQLRQGTPPISLTKNLLSVPKITLDFSSPQGLSGSFIASGRVHNAVTSPELDLSVDLLPIDLSTVSSMLPDVERASGTLQANLAIQGSVRMPHYSGEVTLRNGALAIRGLPLHLDNAQVAIRLDDRQIKLERATARIGGGTVSAVGTLPVKGFDFGTAIANVTAKGVRLPFVDGVSLMVDADLSAAWSARLGEEDRSIPKVVGDVTLTSFEYTRPISLSADLGALTQRGKRTRFETYDPEADYVGFEIRVRAPNPLRLRNNLADMQLSIDNGALTLSGTNQRIGLRGNLRVKPGSRLRLRSSDFEVRQGVVRFDDPSKIAPSVDITAVTEYRRYSQAQASTVGSTGSGAATAARGPEGVGKTGGQWRIQLHARGDAENLRLELTSEPALSQEDIILLLTLGVTRAELDQMQASNLGETAALEALSTLTGADSAIRGAIPVVDDIKLGGAYSSRTGRTEPTVTIGKRLTERVRANVTSGLGENREVRSNIEWQLTPRASVLGSYDNVNNASSSSIGNLGADMRFRIEFE